MEHKHLKCEGTAGLEERVLLLPPTYRDAQAMCAVLADSGIECVVFDSVPQLCHVLSEGAAAIIVAEEALIADAGSLRAYLADQPVWGDIPTVVLSRAGSESPKRTHMLATLGNVSIVERPVRITTFLSIVRAALRSRQRQYEVRDHLRRLQAIEAERTALWESERNARAEAERAGRLKDEFLATLSHEIRTPLNAIMGWTYVLTTATQTESQMRRGLEVIDRNAKAQSRLIADLLDMNRIVNGKVRLDARRIDLAPVLQAAIETVTPLVDAKGITMHATVEDCEQTVSGDPERLQQVFWNILSNATKFTPKNGFIEVSLRRVNSYVEVSVSDTGEGMTSEFLPNVFDRFRQADGSTIRRHGGLGLGLAIAKQLVELHGGTIQAMSPGPNEGSTFVVAIPVATGPDDESPMLGRGPLGGRVATPLPQSASHLAGIKVVVVDNELDSSQLVQRLLEEHGARVLVAASADEALTVIRKARPDLLISDIGMPGEDGYSLIRRLRLLPPGEGGRIASIALTAYARDEDRDRALRSGFQYHVSKPVDAYELVAAVASATRRSKS